MLDGFVGGTTLVASRRCMPSNIEAAYIDVAVRRWGPLTGQTARLGGDGGALAHVHRGDAHAVLVEGGEGDLDVSPEHPGGDNSAVVPGGFVIE